METNAQDNTAVIDAAFENFRTMMAKDGYLLSWTEAENDRVVVLIEAGPEACADCLAPQPVIEAIMAQALAQTPYELDHVVLPSHE